MWLRSLQPVSDLTPSLCPTVVGSKLRKAKAWCQFIKQATIQAAITKPSNVTELQAAPSATKAQLQGFHLGRRSWRSLGTVALLHPCIIRAPWKHILGQKPVCISYF